MFFPTCLEEANASPGQVSALYDITMVGFTDVEQSKDVTGNLSQSLALVFLI